MRSDCSAIGADTSAWDCWRWVTGRDVECRADGRSQHQDTSFTFLLLVQGVSCDDDAPFLGQRQCDGVSGGRIRPLALSRRKCCVRTIMRIVGGKVASLFVSYSRSDRIAAERIRTRLERDGFAAVFIDVDVNDGIPAGRAWERELYSQLYRTDAVIFLASPASVASKWCFAEVSLARSLGRPVFPVRLTDGADLALLDDVQWIDLRDGDQAYVQLRRGLHHAGLDPSRSYGWDPTRSPYPGLRSFDPEDAAVFFGRDKEIKRLVDLLQPTLERGRGRFVAIIGPSGSGKSSLMRAGLLPRLMMQRSRWTVLPTVLPGRRPMGKLVRSIADAYAERGRLVTASEVGDMLARGPQGLREIVGDLDEREVDVLVVIDQAEELSTRSTAAERDAFLGLLRGALTNDSLLWVIATLRSEFLSGAPERAGLADAIDDAVVVEPLHRRQLPEVIERPAQRAGVRYEPGLVARMVDEAAGGDALPLLAHTLRELYERVDRNETITWAVYEELGGVVGALRNRADRLLDELERHRGGAGHVLPTLLKLAAVTGNDDPTRRRVRRSALTADELAVVDAFLDARLLISRVADGDVTVEVAHEALLRQWTPLDDAIDAARTSLRLRTELERLAEDWAAAGRDESYLLRGERLVTFASWVDADRDAVGEQSRQYVDASSASDAREREEVRRFTRRRRLLTAGVAVLLALLAVIGAIAAFPRIRQAQLRRQVVALTPTVRFEAVNAIVGVDGTAGRPEQRVQVDAFQLDVYEVTDRAYGLCVEAGLCLSPIRRGDRVEPMFPVVYVNARQAFAFCRWVDRRLPTVVELERAARGSSGRPWPWGDEDPVLDRANVQTDEAPPRGLVAVDDPAFEDGATPQGVTHLVGNAAEWTATPTTCIDDPYGCRASWDGQVGREGVLLQGGNWQEPATTIADFNVADVTMANDAIGFRCARSEEGR